MTTGFWGSSGFVATPEPLADRRPHDFYPSPVAVCHAALKLIPYTVQPQRILDPGAGTGVWGQAARQRWPLADIDGVEIREEANGSPDYTTWWRGDFLAAPLSDSYDLIIGNPPFANNTRNADGTVARDRRYAEKFVRRALALTADGGRVLFLLRLAFLEGQERARGLFNDYPPAQVAVLANRPSFMPVDHIKAGKTDATAYAIFMWQKGWQGTVQLSWLLWKKLPGEKMR